jgi:hypothetical protein
VRQPVTVKFAMGGTAKQGTDYTLTTSTEVTIPAGQSSATVTMHAIADHMAEPNEAVTMMLRSATGYTVPFWSSNATVTILNVP